MRWFVLIQRTVRFTYEPVDQKDTILPLNQGYLGFMSVGCVNLYLKRNNYLVSHKTRYCPESRQQKNEQMHG